MAPTFIQALEQAELLARQALPPALHERLSCAVALAKDGRVFQTSDGTWQVDSASTEGLTYTVNGTCACHDAHYNHPPQGLCKHRLAVLLARKAAQLMVVTLESAGPVETPVPTPAPPLPEAPASVNLRAMLYGFEVQITLRDGDERTLIDRLAALVKTPGLKPVPKPVPRTQWRKGGPR